MPLNSESFFKGPKSGFLCDFRASAVSSERAEPNGCDSTRTPKSDGERTRRACGFRRPAETFHPTDCGRRRTFLNGQPLREKRSERVVRRAAETRTRASARSPHRVGYRAREPSAGWRFHWGPRSAPGRQQRPPPRLRLFWPRVRNRRLGSSLAWRSRRTQPCRHAGS